MNGTPLTTFEILTLVGLFGGPIVSGGIASLVTFTILKTKLDRAIADIKDEAQKRDDLTGAVHEHGLRIENHEARIGIIEKTRG